VARPLQRPDGVEIHWQERGRGPNVLIAHQVLWSFPGVYGELIADLARDHRVVTYDPRGCGLSTRRGPYDTETDTADLRAVAEEAGGDAIAIAVGYGYNLAARVGSERPGLIADVLCLQPAAASVLPRHELKHADVLAGSESVLEVLVQLMNTDPRAAVRTVLAAASPELSEKQLRERVARIWDYVTPEAIPVRTQAWLDDDATPYGRALGARLRILHGQAEMIYEGALAARVAELYPDAHLEEVPGGPISRPDLIAAWVRRVSGVRA
jgi:pimeloyl-ACP methyl ester carboxylesterase